ncbi:hypothetical protein D8B26_004242 [Coccidioides posadasii str. Silveira]|uniref:uncharacterized protein n=1 Tax=Coccidioides posadasii (strain RMSCC 757 / Silveira) TaxID=443226 RepID=UPI001BF15B16|nr:hypothetical protein D8B26_004242 [Coccidioides posadasii str. Silveira]
MIFLPPAFPRFSFFFKISFLCKKDTRAFSIVARNSDFCMHIRAFIFHIFPFIPPFSESFPILSFLSFLFFFGGIFIRVLLRFSSNTTLGTEYFSPLLFGGMDLGVLEDTASLGLLVDA